MSSGVNTRQPVVWIVNKGGHDYSEAEKFGRLVPLTTDSVNPFNIDRMMVLLRARLAHAEADDFVLVSGSPILNAVVFCLWLERFGRVNILQWSIRRTRYERLQLTREAVKANANDGIRIAD